MRHSQNQDFELNLAPIIDCFTVLITFMLVSASFISLGILDAGAGIASQPNPGETPPAIAVEIQLNEAFHATIKLSGKSNETTQIPAKNGSWDFETLEKTLGQIRTQWPATDSVVLSASETTEYQQVIQVMDKVRKVVPGIVLGGF